MYIELTGYQTVSRCTREHELASSLRGLGRILRAVADLLVRPALQRSELGQSQPTLRAKSGLLHAAQSVCLARGVVSVDKLMATACMALPGAFPYLKMAND